MIERDGDDFQVDAELLSGAFGLSQAEIKARMRDGRITSRCETGEGEDAGRWRLTFQHEGRALRLVVDGTGAIISRASFPAARRG
ncbi:MAG: DUF6522 family protein [Paracoccus sp. (in: a-proteobacteria)]|nr:DUF6522 family protein [Paracoccus sp. (in: a-proteobacteria)]